MYVFYKKNKLKKHLTDASEMKRVFGVNAKRVSSRMDDIASSPNLKVLMQIPSANCHMLKGDRKGEWGINISANHRLIFEIIEDPIPHTDDGSIDTQNVINIRILEITDYH